jgi:signal peptidase I
MTAFHPVAPARRRLPTGAIVGIVLGGVALLLVVVAVLVALFVFGNGVVRLKVPGAAMEPTIRAGQTVSARKVDAGEYRPKHGDIVVFAAPARWAADDNAQLIKRVIGLPGERLICCDPQGRWMIGGKPLDEPYVKAGSTSGGMSFDVIVPDGRLWVMGDNRAMSNDSRQQFSVTHDIALATVPVSNVSAIVKP